jgi:hypothetical protein
MNFSNRQYFGQEISGGENSSIFQVSLQYKIHQIYEINSVFSLDF